MKLSNNISFLTIQNLPWPGVSAKRKCLWSSSSRSRGSQVRTDQNIHQKLYFSLFLPIFFNLLAGGVAPPKAPPLPSKLPSIQSSWLIDCSHFHRDWFTINASSNAVKIASYNINWTCRRQQQLFANRIGEETSALVNRWNRAAEFSHCLSSETLLCK